MAAVKGVTGLPLVPLWPLRCGAAAIGAPPAREPAPAARPPPVGTACEATVLAVLAPPMGVAAPDVGMRSGLGRACVCT